MSLFNELKRRNVFRVGIAYAIAAWIMLQVTDVVGEIMELPEWGGKLILLMLAVGFPLALIFAWAFELTPEGIKRESEVDRSESIAPHTGRKLDRAIIAVLALALGYFMLDKFLLEPRRDGAEIQAIEVTPAEPAAVADASTDAPAPRPASAEAAIDQRKSIVVLPFVNMSADPEQEYFSDGLSEELLNVLAKIDDLRVISRTSAFAFKGKDISIPEIAKQLDVAYVLEGSVRSAGNDMRITAQLIEVANDSHLWSDAYNRRMENIFDVQVEISEAIAQALQVELGTKGAADRPTESLEAYQLYLRGRHHYQARGQDNMQLAIDALEQAIAKDPEFDEAWANLAAAYGVMSYYVSEGYNELYRKAEEAARKAIALNHQNGFGRAVLGLLYHGEMQFGRAMEELDLAIELSPSESNAYLWAGITLSTLGYVDRAIEYLQRAERFDPVFPNLQNWLYTLHVMAGEFDKAKVYAERLHQLDPSFRVNYAGEIALAQGDLDLAEREMLETFENAEGSTMPNVVKTMFNAIREPSKLPEATQIILAVDDGSEYVGTFWILFRLGELDLAIANWRQFRAAGRLLRTTNALGAVWLPYDRDQLSRPELLQFLEELGITNYWLKHGDPDFCTRQPDDSFKCGAP
jgi:TolB-like protein/Flp pilus assembly protein TadD